MAGRNRRNSGRRGGRGKGAGAGVLAALLAVAAVIWVVASARHNECAAPTEIAAESLEKVTVPPGTPEELLRYRGMTVSFNPETHQPNYVVWELLGSEVQGEEPRSNDFQADPAVKGSAVPDDYKYTGYDRGHMAPAGDMKWDAEAMRESFLMTNMCPQAPELNRGAWKKLEEKCRARAMADSAIIVVCGPIFDSAEPSMRLGNTGVAVPDRFFKVVLMPYTEQPSAIGFIMPNGSVPGGMQTHAVTVDSVEAVTGFDFFSALPDAIEAAVESRCNFNRFSHTGRRK
ncbi:MAG: DNA/RNA non-specific endonuclease [Muribaculaceae bacterium]|nr:DNA/RNA non-specific endonuclease [Muribaculaceae bacterium]